jgi:hypothetical protein
MGLPQRRQGLELMNWRRGFFRLWLVLSAGWVAGIGYLDRESLCASYSIKAWEEARRQEQKSQEDYRVCLILHPKDKCELPDFIGGNIHYENRCLPMGDDAPNWDLRVEALKQMFVPPFVVLLAGLVVLWVMRGFRHGKPRH